MWSLVSINRTVPIDEATLKSILKFNHPRFCRRNGLVELRKRLPFKLGKLAPKFFPGTSRPIDKNTVYDVQTTEMLPLEEYWLFG